MAKILYLIRCTACKKRIKNNESYTFWEKEHYCEPCFEDYMNMVDPNQFLYDENDNEDK